MNPYKTYSELLITCVSGPIDEIINVMLASFNAPTPSGVEQALMSGANEVQVFENGIPKLYRKGDPLPPRNHVIQYFSKEVPLDFSLAYFGRAERDTTKEERVIFWEPKSRPGTVAFMGKFYDGMSHTIWSLSRESVREWINLRIYEGHEFPGCFFDYYVDHQKVLRRVMACKDEEGWDFIEEGLLQPFENPDYYVRRLKKDRLNREIIREYMDNLGYEIQRDEFWETNKPAQLLWQDRKGNHTMST